MAYAEFMALYTHTFQVNLHDTDAAGVLFFAHLLRHAHDAYEAMMAEGDEPIAELIRAGRVHLPIVHCEADYLAPIRHGDLVQVEVEPARLGESSFTLHYRFAVADTPAASATTVHVAFDPDRKVRTQLPENIKLIFSNIG